MKYRINLSRITLSRINLGKILFYVIAILLYHSTLIRFYYFNYNYNLVSGVFLFGILLYLFPRINYIYRNNSVMNFAVLCFSVCILCSALVNTTKFAGSLITIVRINVIFWFYEYVSMKEKQKPVCFLYAILGIVYLAITYYYIITYPDKAWRSGLVFFIGSKFYVSYIVIFSFLCWLIAEGDKIRTNILLKGLTLIFLFLCYTMVLQVRCSTGIVGLLLVCAFILGKPFLKIILHKWTVFWTILLISSFIFILFSEVTSLGFVRSFIENFLGRNVSMTGRAIVYNRVFSFIFKEPIFGYGYNSVYDLFKKTMYLGNNAYALDAQNALLEYLLYYGFIGVAVLIGIFYVCFNKPKYKGEILNRDYYAYVGVYVMVMLGSVEITYNMIFFTFLAMIYSQKQVKERNRT